MREVNQNIIPVQAAATITTIAVRAQNLFYVSVQVSSTGAGAGTLKLQASNDQPVQSNVVPTNWSDVPTASVAVSGAGAFLIPKTDLCYEWIRLVYTNSGTGTISAVFKALGA